LIVLITIHGTKMSHILIVPWVTHNIMNLYTFEALQIPISDLCLEPRFMASVTAS
jgi:hypothetical protein